MMCFNAVPSALTKQLFPISRPYFHCFHTINRFGNALLLKVLLMAGFLVHLMSSLWKIGQFLLFQVAHNYEAKIERVGQLSLLM